MVGLHAYASDIEVDGIYYNFNANTKTAEVTFKGKEYYYYNNEYTGTVVIPSEVTYGGKKYSVTSIGSFAFLDCSSLTSVTIPNSVTSIGQSAFYDCSGLTSVTIPNGVTSIGQSAFSGCSGLTTVTIPNSVTSIGGWAFSRCSGLTSITIPNSVTSIGTSAFSGCSSLTSITIPNGVTSIGSGAFMDCSGLTSVTIPNGVTSIYSETFSGCSSLTSVTIPNSVTSIGKNAFYNCSGLSSITIPNGVTSIGEYAFWQCSGLSSITIPNGVTSIGEYAFDGCSGFTSVTIPNSVTSIGNQAFSGCPGLTSVTLNSNSVVSKAYTFSANIKNIFGYQVKEYIIGDEVTSIGDYAFSGRSGLTSVTIPNSVTSIGNYAFHDCTGLTSITIPNGVTSIGNNAFQDCWGLTSITIPNGVTSIGDMTFFRCSGLTSITIPNSVTSIGYKAFCECSGLTSITIPNSVTSIGEDAFSGCSGITSVTIPNSVTSIGDYAFSWCSGLTFVTIPNSVTSIGDGAFSGCSDLTSVTALNPTPVAITENVFTNRTNAKLNVRKRSLEAYRAADYWKEFKWIDIVSLPTHKLIYMVDGEEYKSYNVEEDDPITPEAAPTKEGYTFSGWSDIPATMPAHDVTITGTFSINSYKLTYTVDGQEYKSSTVVYGATVTPETAPTKEGYTFSGWSEIPETMPAHDVTITGTFSINSYKLIYTVDGQEYKSSTVQYGATITPETTPTKEGYTFSGWSDIPATMPAHDVTVTGTFNINSYKLIYTVDGQEYKSSTVEYGATITPETAPTKEGYTFSGWSDIPATMPAHDVTITGTFSVNSYKLTYMIDNEVYKNVTYEYGATITPEPTPEGNYATFEWTDLPQTMPAHDVVVHATYTTGITDILKGNQQDVKVYSPNGKMLAKPEKGINIIRMKDGTTRKVVLK